jgi:hypothetical protein
VKLFEGDLSFLHQKHATELQGLEHVILYEYRSRDPRGALPCPDHK